MSAAETFWRSPMTDETFSFPNVLGEIGEDPAMQVPWNVPQQEQSLGVPLQHLTQAGMLGFVNQQLNQMGPLVQQMQARHEQLQLAAQQGLAAQQLQQQGLMPMPVVLRNMRDLLLPGLQAIQGQYDPMRYWQTLFGGPVISAETAARSKERACGLLKSLLSPVQWEEFQRIGRVTERIAGCEFILSPGGMIEARKPRLIGVVHERWCVAPDPYADGNDYLPEEDKLIGQLLHLRAGPDKLRAQANVFAA